MGWFDEQIRLRKENDQDLFEESVLKMASAIVDRHQSDVMTDERLVVKYAIDEILKYFHKKPVNVPESVHDPMDQLDYALRPYGLMYREVRLSGRWYKEAFGPLLLYRKSDGMPVAAFPKFGGSYFYRDADGMLVRISKKNCELFRTEAICFYKPLPLRPIGFKEVLLYMFECLTASDVIFFVGITLVLIFVGMLLPGVTSFLSGFVLANRRVSLLWGTALFLICVVISTQIISVMKTLAMNRIDIKISTMVEAAIMMRVLSLPAPFFKKFSSGELSSRSQSVSQLTSLIADNVFSLGITSLASLLYVTQIVRYAPGLVIPSLLVIVVTLAVMLLTTFLQMRITKKTMEYAAKESGLSFALISGVQKIKLAGAEKRAFAKWADTYSKEARLTYNPPFFLKISSAVLLAVSLTGTIVMYYFAVTTGVAPAEYIGFSYAYGMVMGAFNAFAQIAGSVAQIRPIYEMAEPILKAEPEAREGKEIVTELTGSIELNNVSFRYNDRMPYVIQNLSLKIRAGEYIAIVGRTGCGKSTLMRLLLGFETPERGSIFYDGKDIKKLDLHSLRQKIGSVTQDGSLFQGDIFSNIVISAPSLTLKEAWEAAEMAGIADDIRMMPMGMQTMISEGQGGISGGQKQRLMIARAVAPKPKILMFDEATSALDNKTQKEVSEALDSLHCTRLVIAHRLSTIRNCDRIIVLKNGGIEEDGTYEELIERNGYFADLVARQRVDLPGREES